jgi:hypothetical protein
MRFRRRSRLVSVADTLGAYDVYGSSIDAGRSDIQDSAKTRPGRSADINSACDP